MSRWYDGSSLPLNQIGVNEDYYLQVPNGDLFRKRYDAWHKIGNIKGEKGDIGRGIDGSNGIDGRNGNAWYHGIGVPSDLLGEEGDYFVELESKDIYQKTDLIWERIGSLLPDGRKVELRNINGAVEYRYEGETDDFWRLLVRLDEIKGIQGEQGEIGITPSIEHLEVAVHEKINELDNAEAIRVANEVLRIATHTEMLNKQAQYEQSEIVRDSAERNRQSSELDRQERERMREDSIASMENRVSTSIAAGTVDLELKDARIDQDGFEYASLRDRLIQLENMPHVLFETVEG